MGMTEPSNANVVEASWEEFKDAGLLWWINRGLHLFGWAIVLIVENEKVVRAFPARCKFRGFCEESEEQGFHRLTQHIEKEIPRLVEDSKGK